MYLPRNFPARAESHCGARLRSGIRTPKGAAHGHGTTDGFAVCSAAAWDVLWNRSPASSGGEHAHADTAWACSSVGRAMLKKQMVSLDRFSRKPLKRCSGATSEVTSGRPIGH